MSKEIRIGVIGAGWMGKAHTTAFHNAKMIFGDEIPVFEIIADVDADQVKKRRKIWATSGGPPTGGTWLPI